jgi:VWFA-related protein
MFRQGSNAFLAVVVLAVTFDMARAQPPPQASDQIPPHTQAPLQATAQAEEQAPGYTIQAHSRIVLTDVTVTGADGRPVRDLPESAFHILDNKKAQSIASFEEHAGPADTGPAAVLEPGIYSNAYLKHLPPVLNILVLDIINLNITDQMYLNYQLTKFLGNVPDGQALAIYLRSGAGSFLLQSFTSDPSLLVAALHKAIPRLPPPGGAYLSDRDTLQQIAIYLSQVPGRKNVIWFSGGSTLFLSPNAAALEAYPDWHDLYDLLEQERIAVYPVDARGLTVFAPPGMFAQHTLMDDVAKATGGHAFYNNNGMLNAAVGAVDTGSNFYTLTYSPRGFAYDNKWHNVKVTVDGGRYHLSYRSGYFADESPGSERPSKPRTRITIDGERVMVPPQLRSDPILFEARVLPASDPKSASPPEPNAVAPVPPRKKGTVPFLVRYMVPASALTMSEIHGKQKVTFGVAAIAFNRYGETVVRNGERVGLTINPEGLRQHPDGHVYIDQQINLEQGDEYLYLAVWDMTSGRLGTLQVPLIVPKAKKH